MRASLTQRTSRPTVIDRSVLAVCTSGRDERLQVAGIDADRQRLVEAEFLNRAGDDAEPPHPWQSSVRARPAVAPPRPQSAARFSSTFDQPARLAGAHVVEGSLGRQRCAPRRSGAFGQLALLAPFVHSAQPGGIQFGLPRLCCTPCQRSSRSASSSKSRGSSSGNSNTDWTRRGGGPTCRGIQTSEIATGAGTRGVSAYAP